MTLPNNEGCKDEVSSDSLVYNRRLSLKNLGRTGMSPPPQTIARLAAVMLISLPVSGSSFLSPTIVRADDGDGSGAASQTTDSPAKKYSDAVVAQADDVLLEAGLRRSGHSLQSTDAADLSRLLSRIARSRRELRLQQNDVADARAKLTAFDNEIDKLQRQDGELNLQLARVAGLDVGKNNRLVALINVTRNQVRQLRKQHAKHDKAVQAARTELNSAEQKYAESVFQVRKRFDELQQTIDAQLQDRQIQIAVGVMHTNFDVPQDIDADKIVRAVENRLRDFEKEVFQETIGLDASRSGALFTMVSVNQQSIRMIIDSGATLVTLPAETAATLQVVVPDDAPILRLQLATGEQISGRRVTLDSVRVGQFEAKDVDAVVLEPIGKKAEPLLGMSYLNRYKFELDSVGKTLGLLRVDESEDTGAKNR